MKPTKVALLLFGSGLCALIYQTTWLREFRLIFGATTPASAAVLAIFMGGLGLGSAWLGNRSERKTWPLVFYGQLELLIALSTAFTPLLIWLVRQAYVGLGGTPQLGLVVGTVVRLVLSALVLALPTFLMGGTLPAAARAVEIEEDLGRRRLALLYGANTLGAVTGAALATFFLLERFGNRMSLWLAGGVNLLVALIAIRLGRRQAARPAPTILSPVPSDELATKESSASPQFGQQARPGFVWLAAAVVGFAFFLMELVWYRLLSPLLGGSAFTFGLVLAVALLGIGLGGIAYALWGQQRPATMRAFAWTCLLEALCLGGPLALGDRIAVWAALLRPLGSFEFYGHVVAWTVIASLVVLPAAVVAGFQFPLLIGLLGKGAREVGRHVGQAYAWNTAGAIAGSLAGGFGVLPLLTAPGTWRAVIALLVLLGLAALALAVLRESRRRGSTVAIGLGLGAAALWTLLSVGPTAAWRHTPIGAGRVELENFRTRNTVRDWIHSYRRSTVWEAEGREVSVAVDDDDGFAFIVNGKSDGNARGDAGTQVMSGLLAAMVHPKPERVFVIGLGSGATAGWLGAVPSVKRVDVVELEPAIRRVAELCSPANRNVLTNPKVNVIVGDGREVLLTTPHRYDLVVSVPSNLYRAGVASLFTREFYRSAARKLNEGGLFAQWLQGYDTDLEALRTVMATLSSVFAVVECWVTEDVDLLFLASLRPITYDVSALRQRLQEEPFQTAVEKTWRVTDLEGVFARYLARADFCQQVAQSAPVLNTDDRTVLEFAYARSLGSGRVDHLSTLRIAALQQATHQPSLTNGQVNWRRVVQQQSSAQVLDNVAPEVPRVGSNAISRAQAKVQYVAEDLEEALQYWQAQPDEPQDLVEWTMVAELLAEAGEAEALPYLEKLRRHEPVEADALLARFHWRNGDAEKATAALEAAFTGYRRDPWPQPRLMRRALKLAEEIAEEDRGPLAKRLCSALETPFALHCENFHRIWARLDTARRLDGKSFSAQTLAAIEAFEPFAPWTRDFLELRQACYEENRHPQAARAMADLESFLRYEPRPLFPELPEEEEEQEASGP